MDHEAPSKRVRAAVVTGAASGIGRALVLETARRGFRPIALDVHAPGLQETLKAAKAIDPLAEAHLVDVRDRDAMAKCAAALPPELETALLFANAGVFKAGDLAAQPASDVDLMIDVNLRGVLHTIAAFQASMMTQKQPSRIVITASQAAFLCAPQIGAYTATKHALWAIAETLALELKAADAPVGVTLLCPGAVRTALVDSLSAGPGQKTREAFASAMEKRGDDAGDVARLACDAALAGRFWAFPKSVFKPLALARLADAMDERPPTGT